MSVVSVPLRGVGCFNHDEDGFRGCGGFRPLAGCGLFQGDIVLFDWNLKFPSPCGVWVVSLEQLAIFHLFGFRPLAGCGLFQEEELEGWMEDCFRPLAGCGLFLQVKLKDYITKVSVPLRGVGCFARSAATQTDDLVSVPLRGVGCFIVPCSERAVEAFPSPCGVWVVSRSLRTDVSGQLFPSPCGVWVVSGRACGSSGPRSFRPLAGCGLFLRFTASKSVPCVSVPLRGVGCF